MFGVVGAEMVVLVVLMVALGVVPGLLALSSQKARSNKAGAMPLDLRMPGAAAPAHRFHFGAATSARG